MTARRREGRTIADARFSRISFHRRSRATLYLCVPLLLLAAVLQSTAFTHLNLYGAVPDLVLVAVVLWVLLRGGREGYAWAFAGGLALDLLTAGPLGLSSLALLLTAALLGLAEGHVDSFSTLFALLAVALGTLAFHALVLLGLAIGGHAGLLAALGAPLPLLLATLALNVLAALPLHWLLKRLYLAAEQGEVRLKR